VTKAPLTEFSSSATFDVVSGVGRPPTGSTTGLSNWLHRVSYNVVIVLKRKDLGIRRKISLKSFKGPAGIALPQR